MNERKIFKRVAIVILLIFLLQNIIPTVYKCYAASEDEVNDDSISDVVENIDDEEKENIIEQEINEDNNQEEEEIKLEETKLESDEIDEEGMVIEMNDDMPIVRSASGGGANAGNEAEFSNLFYNTGVGELTLQSSIRLNSIYTVNHTMRIDCSSQSGGNALQLSSGCSIIVPNGCVLTLDEVVIDGRSFSNNDGKSCITVQNGGVLMLTGHSIIDGGTKNWGINVENGGQLLVASGRVTYCDRGIVLQGNSYCDLASNTAVSWWGNDGKKVEINYNSTGIYCGGAYKGTLIVNHLSGNGENIDISNNTYGIFAEGHSGSINIVRARMVSNGWAIYTFGNMTIENVNGAFNTRGIVCDGATVWFKSGTFYSDGSNLKEYGVYNLNGTVNMQGGSVYNDNVGIWSNGTINMSAGNVGNSTTGIENYGTLNLSGGRIASGSYGINNQKTVNMSNGTITGFSWGVKNPATFNISGGNITGNTTFGIVNESSNSITGQVYMTGGNITGNTNYDIYHGKSDGDTAGAVYGGLRIERNDTVTSKIILDAYDNYIYTGSSSPTLTNVTLGNTHLERKVIRGANTSNTSNMVNKVTVNNKGSYYLKANGVGHSGYVSLWTNYTVTTYHKTDKGATLGSSTQTIAYKDNYTTSESTFENYVLKTTPANASGVVTGNISVTYIYEDDRNVAVVNYKDLLSGITIAKYWYNADSESFSGNGTSFNDGKVFEDYGYYKVTVINGVGLSKTITFELNESSV